VNIMRGLSSKSKDSSGEKRLTEIEEAVEGDEKIAFEEKEQDLERFKHVGLNLGNHKSTSSAKKSTELVTP